MSRVSWVHRQRGFSLLTALVLVGVVLIGVGLALPLANRHQDARRRSETRVALERAFRGLFPFPTGSPGADLRTDFGFTPVVPTQLLRPGDATPGWTLRALIDPSGVGALDPTHNHPALFTGANAGAAWNGPYWQGSLDAAGLPVDAWGRAIQLRYVTFPSAGWIVHSPGGNGLDDTDPGSGTPGGDDLVYPTPPYVLPLLGGPTYTATFNFSFVLNAVGTCSPANNVDLTVVVTYQDATQTRLLTLANSEQLHRNNKGKPNRIDYLNQALTLRQDSGGGTVNLQIRVDGGCPDGIISPVDFQPSTTSGITYLGSSTSGSATTYFFTISPPIPPATSITPWSITIQP